MAVNNSPYNVGSGKTYSTISAAITQIGVDNGHTNLSSTYTIIVYNGTYNEYINTQTLAAISGTATNHLIIQAAPSNSPVLDGGATLTVGLFASLCSYVDFSGFEVKNYKGTGVQLSAGGFGSVYSCTIHNCYNGITMGGSNIYSNTIYSNSTSGITGNGTSGNNVYNNTIYLNGNGITISENGDNIYNNIVYSNTGIGIKGQAFPANIFNNLVYSNGSHGILNNSSTFNPVYGNFCYSNGGDGINADYCKVFNNVSILNTGNGLRVNNFTRGGLIYNNTFYNNSLNGITVGTVSGGPPATGLLIKNNIVVQAVGSCIYANTTAGITVNQFNYNNFYPTGTAVVGFWSTATCTILSAWQSASSQDSNSISSNPLFFNPGITKENGYLIPPNSPCVDIGMTLTTTVTTDYYGIARPFNSRFDLGFYEFSPTYLVGSGRQHFSTIQSAVTAVYSVNTTNAFTLPYVVSVNSGTYAEAVTVNPALVPTTINSFSIIASVSQSPIIDGTNTLPIGITSTPTLTICGFEIKNFTNSAIKTNVSNTIKSNTIHNNGSYGIYDNGQSTFTSNIISINGIAGIMSNAAAKEINSNIIFSNPIYGVFNNSTTANTLIHNNTFYSNSIGLIHNDIVYNNLSYLNTSLALGIRSLSYPTLVYNNLSIFDYVGIQIGGASQVYNNTIYGSVQSGFTGGDNGVTIVKNNVVVVTVGYCIQLNPGAIYTSDYNDFYPSGSGSVGQLGSNMYNTLANWISGTGFDTHSISSNPIFINVGTLVPTDYKVASTSPCINLAQNLSATFTIDYFGIKRKSTSNWTIGFYEFYATANKVLGVTLSSISKICSVTKSTISKFCEIKII